MGKKVVRVFLVIVFFSVTIIFFIIKNLFSKLQKKRISTYLSQITLDSIDNLSGVEFEDFMYYLLLSLDFDVKKTKPSHDYGADLIINLNNKTIVVQCKLYHNHSVGNSAVQEIYTATNYYNAHLGMIVTNSFFSRPAINLAEKSGIRLWNRETLSRLISIKGSEKKLLKNELMSLMY